MPRTSSALSRLERRAQHGRPPLAQHQQENVEWAAAVRRGLLADEPGLGKSRSSIEAVRGAGRVLVVAPALIISTGTWADEIERWADDPSRFQVVPYTGLNARQANRSPNYGTKRYPKYQLKPEVAGHYDAVILDEAHYIKGLDTYWTWSVQRIAKHADMVLPMTGTPMPNWAHELFTVLRVLRPEEAKRGQRLGSYWHWVERWFTTAPSRFSEFQRTIGGLRDCEYHADCKRRSPDDPCEHWLAFARENLGDQYMRHLQAEVFDLPPMVAQDIQVPLDSAARRMYAELRKDYITETESGAEVMAWNQGARNVMLDKLTTSPWLLDPQGTPRGGKLDMLRFDLESRTRPTVVFAHYQATVEACAGVAKDLGRRVAYVHGGVSPQVTRRAVRAFQAGELDVLVGSYEKMAEGVTLTQADQAIFVETSFKPSKNTQARRRIHRIGQTRPCVSRTYITPGTVDAHKQILLREKNDQTLAAMTAAEFARLL